MTCRWLVDATGRAATVATARGARRTTEDTLVAFHARFVPARGAVDRDSRTLIESGADGWWYSTLQPSGERIAAFLTDRDQVARRQLLSRDGLLERIAETRHIRGLIEAHGYTMIGRPRGVHAASSRLDVVHGDGWVAVGDAALTFDPLSSQGIFNALYTGLHAGLALTHALTGDAAALARYAERIEEIHRAYRRNLATFYAMEARWPKQTFWARRNGSLLSTTSLSPTADETSAAHSPPARVDRRAKSA